jgi:hypothetical protein
VYNNSYHQLFSKKDFLKNKNRQKLKSSPQDLTLNNYYINYYSALKYKYINKPKYKYASKLSRVYGLKNFNKDLFSQRIIDNAKLDFKKSKLVFNSKKTNTYTKKTINFFYLYRIFFNK